MGLFNKKKTEEEKIEENLNKFGLNLDEYSVSDIKRENAKNIQRAAKVLELSGMSTLLGGGDSKTTNGLLNAIVNQNWILIRQNEILIRLLEK